MPKDGTLAKVKKGNQRAFRHLFDQYHAKVYHYVLRFSRNQDDAQDLTQKVFIQLWEQRQRILLDRPIDAYLFTIAHNLSCNFLKQQARHKLMPIENALLVSTSTDTEYTVQLNELSALASQSIDSLPEKRQVIFKMYYQENFSYEEIASALHLSIHTVKSQVQKGSGTIRKMIRLAASMLIIYFG